MATYDYSCGKCGFREEQIHSMKEQPVFFCPHCKNNGKEVQMTRIFTLNPSGFIIKGGTETINWKEKRYRMKKNLELGKRQIERYGSSGPKLKPNVFGVEQESWSDAAKVAKESGINTNSYQSMIDKEKNTSKDSGINDTTWRKAKEDLL
jgi:putative FmdB family regulatory protein